MRESSCPKSLKIWDRRKRKMNIWSNRQVLLKIVNSKWTLWIDLVELSSFRKKNSDLKEICRRRPKSLKDIIQFKWNLLDINNFIMYLFLEFSVWFFEFVFFGNVPSQRASAVKDLIAKVTSEISFDQRVFNFYL